MPIDEEPPVNVDPVDEELSVDELWGDKVPVAVEEVSVKELLVDEIPTVDEVLVVSEPLPVDELPPCEEVPDVKETLGVSGPVVDVKLAVEKGDEAPKVPPVKDELPVDIMDEEREKEVPAADDNVVDVDAGVPEDWTEEVPVDAEVACVAEPPVDCD